MQHVMRLKARGPNTHLGLGLLKRLKAFLRCVLVRPCIVVAVQLRLLANTISCSSAAACIAR